MCENQVMLKAERMFQGEVREGHGQRDKGKCELVLVAHISVVAETRSFRRVC